MTVGDDTWEARDRSDGSREVQRFQRNSSTTTPLRINKGSMTKQGDGRKSLKPFVLVSLSRWPMKEGGGGVLIERPSDPPQGVVRADTTTLGIVESRDVCPRRSVEGRVDDAKLVILQTCTIGWVKEAWSQTVAPDSHRAWISNSGLPIHLWSEGAFRNIAGLWGSYLRVDAATEEPSSFERARVLLKTSFLGRIDEVVHVTVQGSLYAVVIQEAELVWVPAVEDREVESELEMGEKSNKVSVASPQLNVPSKQVRRLPRGGCGGVCSAGDVAIAAVGDRTRVSVDAVLNPELEGDRDSPIGLLECGESNLNAAGSLGCNARASSSSSSSPLAVVGVAGATLAPVLGAVSGGLRKVKSMNCLVEALASPEQSQVVAAARSHKGLGRPAKNRDLIEVGSDIVNASLIDSDIQGRIDGVDEDVASRG
ncbi:hypothetical protein V6N12_001428 [Hibiscus sabdariffa]|uniref:DUF4283 domain-containing protein n=1 Tax=Hibiscus sabdariffa TaxID=183260 RepID=A0ABR2A161_9ROSI